MVENKQEELTHKLIDVINDVSQELIEQKGISPNFKSLHFGPGNMLRPSDEFMKELMRPSTVAEKFSVSEIEDKLKKAFNHRGLKGTRFEFGVSSDINMMTYEKRSNNFLNSLEDTVHNLREVYPLQVAGSTDLDDIVPAETLSVIIPDYKNIVIRQMYWKVAGVIFFTLMITSLFTLRCGR